MKITRLYYSDFNALMRRDLVFSRCPEEEIEKVISDYIHYLQGLVETEQIKKHTLQCKNTSLKKLIEYLAPYDKPSDIPHDVFADYTKWRRTKNWTKYHRNNSRPPSDLTINRELTDFKGFFDWCSNKKILTNNFEYPWIKYDPKKHTESSPPFTFDDYTLIIQNLSKWYGDKELIRKRKNNFYRIVFAYYFEILSQTGMRPHECLKLRWSDVEIISEFERVDFVISEDDEYAFKLNENEILLTTQDGIDIMRWVPFIRQIGPLTSLTQDGRNRVWSHYRPDREFCHSRRCEVLHGHTSR